MSSESLCKYDADEGGMEIEHQSEIQSWLSWCRAHPNVHCVEQIIPDGILPKSFTGKLIDIKVSGKRPRGDDLLYSNDKNLREKVARGNCILELIEHRGSNDVRTSYIALICAMRKFTSGLGDDDTSANCEVHWPKYFKREIGCTRRVVVTEKENGEAAHISCISLTGLDLFCLGSKNVHILIKGSDDIKKYDGLRFRFVSEIGHTFFQSYIENPQISLTVKKGLILYLQMTRYTIVAEFLQPDNQHVVNLNHLPNRMIKVICWTSGEGIFFNKKSQSYTSLPVITGIKKAREFGLQTVDYKVVEIYHDAEQELQEQLVEIRREMGTEGKVIYFVYCKDQTIGVIKKKSIWYTILRALRQNIVNLKPNSQLSKFRDGWRDRLSDLQDWLDLPQQSVVDVWQIIGELFAHWIMSTQPQHAISSKFPVVFSDFLCENRDAKLLYDIFLTVQLG